MAKATLEPIDGGGSRLTPGKGMEVDAPEPIRQPRRGNRPVEKTITAVTDAESEDALASLGSIEAAEATATQKPIEIALRDARDKILRMKATRTYWERLEYAQRQTLNGALALAQELLGDKDDAGLPLTLSRFLGLQLPR